MRTFVASATALLLISGCSEYDLSAKPEPVEAALPVIQVTPAAIDFGIQNPGSEHTEYFRIENIGEATLSLGDLELRGDTDAFTLTTEASNVDLEPGESIDSMVTYVAGLDASTGRVIIPSDDANNPDVKVPLNGGVAITDKPVAICSVDPAEITAITGSATLIGDQSFDPDGLALTYQWSGVVRPPGSNATVPAGAANQPNRPGFQADLVGTYGFQLIVTNENGVASDPCLTELEAIPGNDLWVEMYWAHNNDDMDLHLTRAGGALNSGDDCYFSNCTGGGLEWGPNGAAGNPALDLDDIPGTGPENINVTDPEDITYGVWVHDYQVTGPWAGDNDVTINIYIGGQLEWSDTRNITGEGSETHFADIDYASRSVIPR